MAGAAPLICCSPVRQKRRHDLKKPVTKYENKAGAGVQPAPALLFVQLECVTLKEFAASKTNSYLSRNSYK